jgi:hypothetical protein
MRSDIGMMPLLVIGRTVNFSQSVRQQDFGANDLEAKASAFMGQNLHEAIQTLGVPGGYTVSEVSEDRISILFDGQDKGPEHISNIGGDLVQPGEIALTGFFFCLGLIDAVKSFLESVGSFQPGKVLEPSFKNERIMFVQGIRAFQQQESIMHQGSSLSICQVSSYLLANGFKTFVKQFQHMPFIGDQVDMRQNSMNSIVVSRPQIGTDDGDLFFHAVGQTLQIVDDRLLMAVTKQLDDLMMLNVSDDTSILVQQVQFIYAQVAYSRFWKTRLDTSSKFAKQKTNGSFCQPNFISDAGKRSAQSCLLNVTDQAVRHEVVFVHMGNWLKKGSMTGTTFIASTMNDDPDVLPSDRLVQVGLWFYLMPVQFRMAAMGTTRRRRDQLRLNVKVVFILIYRKDVVVGQSQDVQKALSPKKELPHKFSGSPEIPVASEGRLLRVSCFYSPHFYECALVCTDVNKGEIPRTFTISQSLTYQWILILMSLSGIRHAFLHNCAILIL